MTSRTKSLIVVAGPTATGKSALALDLAARFGGTIINADALQIYRDLRILTARPDEASEARAPHRLYGVLDAAERGSVARWRELAEAEIEAAAVPILVGGTGLHLRALLSGLSAVPDIPAAIRAESGSLYRELGGEEFRRRLADLDPDAADVVAEAVARLASGRTTLLITHRPELVAAADRVVALRHGRLVELRVGEPS